MAGPPTKQVTLLFTDIVGSTSLWERDRAAMSSALLGHDRLLEGLIVLHEGTVIKTTGDGFAAAFDRASAALEAGVAIRDVIERMPWSESGELRVRIALHTGDAEFRDDDYFGPTVNRVARLLQTVRGGQIVASGATIELVEHRLPTGVSLRDLGEVRLRDVPEPMRVYMLEGRRGAHPSTRSSGPSDRHATAGHHDAGRPGGDSGQAPATPGDDTLRVYTLGSFRIERGGRQVFPSDRKTLPGLEIFKYLITLESRHVSKERVMDLFLKDSFNPQGTLRTRMLRFREALEPDVPTAESIIDSSDDVLEIRPIRALWVDADEFERLVTRARRADNPDELLEEADRLYRGEYLPDELCEDWSIPRRRYLERLWAELQLELARRRERRGDAHGAQAALERLLAADACDERAARELMLLLARHGGKTSALRVFQRLAEALQAELAAQPSAETLDVHRRIRDGEMPAADDQVGRPHGSARDPAERRAPPAGDAPAAPPLPPAGAPDRRDPPGDRSGSDEDGTPEPGSDELGFEPQYSFPEPELLVGRQRELQAVHRALEQGRTQGRTILIGAPAGTGKSTLAGLLVDQARSMGFLCLAGGSFDQDDPAPYAPIRDALCDYLLEQPPDRLRAELGDLAADLVLIVPMLGDHLGGVVQRASGPPDPGHLRETLHRYLHRLATRRPVVLCLEDLHAADGATLDAVRFLARLARRLHVTLVATYRTEELPADRRLADVLTALERERLADKIVLRAFDRAETLVLISSLLDGAVSEELTDAVFAVTEGNPLFVEQLVLSLREEGRIERRKGIWHQVATDSAPIPPVIRSVIERRLDRLSPYGRELLELAAVMGQTFELRPLVAALGTADDAAVVAVLDQAIRSQLVHETANRYRLGHAMIREALYWGLSGPRRALLHARVGAALERLAGPRAGELAAELAHHFSIAAEVAPTAGKALRYSLEAGRRAALLSAYQSALVQYARACAILEREGEHGDPTTRLDALEGRGNAQRDLAMWLPCIASFRAVLDLTGDPMRRGRAHGAIAYSLQQIGDTDAALAEAEAGLGELEGQGEAPEVVTIRLQSTYLIAFLRFLHGRYGEVLRLGQQMLPVAEKLGQLRPLFWAHSSVAWGFLGLGRIDEAVEHHRHALVAAEREDNKVIVGLAHSNLGNLLYLGGRFAEARQHLDRAIALYQDAGSHLRAVITRQTLGRIWLAEGEPARAREQADVALSVATEGQDRWEAECHDLLGAIQSLHADWDAAERCYRQALDVRERVRDTAGTVESLVGLGLVAQRRGDWARAGELYARAVNAVAELDPSPQEVAARRYLGRLLWLIGDDAAASEQLVRAFALAEGMTGTIEYPPTLLVMAEVRWRAGDLDGAIEAAERGLATAVAVDAMVEARVVLATLLAMARRFDEARSHARDAQVLTADMDAPRLRGLAYLAAGRVAAADDLAAAEEAFSRAVEHFDAARTPYERALTLRDYARALADHSALPERARAALDDAIETFRRLGAHPALARAHAPLNDARSGAELIRP